MPNKEIRNARKAAGRCVSCGRKLKDGETRVTCEKCRLKASEHNHMIYDQRLFFGLCVECGRPIRQLGMENTQCEACREKNRLKRKRQKEKKEGKQCDTPM